MEVNMSENPFVVGGCVDWECKSYIQRAADNELITAVKRMEYVTISEPRQQGKTSLILSLPIRLGSNYIIVYINLIEYNSENEKEWYKNLCNKIIHETRKKIPSLQISQLPHNSTEWGYFIEILCKQLQNKYRLVVAFDEMANTPTTWRTPFYNKIRALYDNRRQKSLCHLNKINFIFSGSYDPDKLIEDPLTSPFNVATEIYLKDFTLEQTSKLTELLPVDKKTRISIAKRIQFWADGQPFITQWICKNLLNHKSPTTIDGVDQATCQFWIDDNRHLPRIIKKLEQPKKAELLNFVEKLHNGDSAPEFIRSLPIHRRLAHIGILKVDKDGLCKIRNRIYENAIDQLLKNKSVTDKSQKTTVIDQNCKKVFVVYGHDLEMKDSVARFLSLIDLEPVILNELPSMGNTIIEKFENSSGAQVAIILLSPDDQGRSVSEKKYSHRARQNVILELGFFLGVLGRKHVFSLQKGNIEIPSDFMGIIPINFDESGAWKLALLMELKQSGLKIDANKLFKRSS